MGDTPGSFVDWVTEHFLSDLRSGAPFTEQVVENIAAFPFIDSIRSRLTESDRDKVLDLLNSPNWWEARLGISISRSVCDEQMITRIVEIFCSSHELRLRLSAAFTLAELAPHLIPQLETFLDHVLLEQPKQLQDIVEQFYGKGHPPEKLIARVARKSPGHALYLRLLSLFPASDNITV